jgi:hypothetical protein
MKNKLILFILMLLPIVAFPEIDSLMTEQIIEGATPVAANIISTLIPGVPNELIYAILTAITAVVHRYLTIRKWKKNGKITK